MKSKCGSNCLCSGVNTPDTCTYKVKRSCNRHADCDEADEDLRNNPNNRKYYGQIERYYADHCHDDCCEDCFGY